MLSRSSAVHAVHPTLAFAAPELLETAGVGSGICAVVTFFSQMHQREEKRIVGSLDSV